MLTVPKRWHALALAALLGATPALRAESANAPETAKEKMGYAIGVELASKFKKEKFDFDVEMAAQGLRDAMNAQVKMTPEELAYVINGFQVEFRRKVNLNRRQALMANRARNDRFFAENRQAQGVRLLPSGVQYRVLQEGTGPKPTDADAVHLRYRGTLLDGSEFGRSVGDEPTRMKVASLVQGWRIAVSAMPVGSHWQVWVPPALAYADRGDGDKVGPQEPLVLDLELVAIGR